MGLLHQQGADTWVLEEIFHHLAEAGTSTLSCRLDVDIFVEDGDAVRRGVFAQQFKLSGNREAFLLLLLEMKWETLATAWMSRFRRSDGDQQETRWCWA
jgi:hypothetical protein